MLQLSWYGWRTSNRRFSEQVPCSVQGSINARLLKKRVCVCVKRYMHYLRGLPWLPYFPCYQVIRVFQVYRMIQVGRRYQHHPCYPVTVKTVTRWYKRAQAQTQTRHTHTHTHRYMSVFTDECIIIWPQTLLVFFQTDPHGSVKCRKKNRDNLHVCEWDTPSAYVHGICRKQENTHGGGMGTRKTDLTADDADLVKTC